MNKIQILISHDDGIIDEALRNMSGWETDLYAVSFSNGVDETLEKIARDNPDICLVREKNGHNNTQKILRDIKEAGLRTPVVAIVEPDNIKVEPDLVALGGKGVIPNDSSLQTVLRHFVRYAADIKQTLAVHTAEKEEVIRQLFDQQDARERAEEQSSNLIDLAEDLAITKEELARLNDEKNKFFSIIAHDLRSPFTSILGYTELLASTGDKLPPDKVKKYAENANEAGLSVFKLLENLLDWALLQMDKMVYAPEIVSFADIVGKTIELLNPVAIDKGIKLESVVTEETAYFDPLMTETVIRNLVNNAIKFTDQGGSIVIAAKELNDFIEVGVTDSGIGMNPDKATNIFSLSENNSTNGTRGEKGTGLGLLLSKELVERNGGEIYATSKLGEGSTFAFTVPKNAPVN